jgi:aspartate racemase
MNKKEKVLGILGGMGTYAGLNFVKNFLKEWEKAYKIEKEWDYPHFILDSNCKLPSRVRCIVYNEDSPSSGMLRSIKNLKKCGADIVVVPCNTAHFFLDKIRDEANVPIADMIKLLFECLQKKKIKKINVLASEGTALADIYGKYGHKIEVKYAKDGMALREVIEGVKKNSISKVLIEKFKKNLDDNVYNILGCTEFSLLYSENRPLFKEYKIIDAEEETIKYLVKILKNE